MKIVKWVRHPEGTAEIPPLSIQCSPLTLPLTISSAVARPVRTFGDVLAMEHVRSETEQRRNQNPKRPRRPPLHRMATVFIDLLSSAKDE